MYVLYDWQQKLFLVGSEGRTGYVTRSINRCREFVRVEQAIDYGNFELVQEWRDDDDAVVPRPTFLARQVTITHEML